MANMVETGKECAQLAANTYMSKKLQFRKSKLKQQMLSFGIFVAMVTSISGSAALFKFL